MREISLNMLSVCNLVYFYGQYVMLVKMQRSMLRKYYNWGMEGKENWNAILNVTVDEIHVIRVVTISLIKHITLNVSVFRNDLNQV